MITRAGIPLTLYGDPDEAAFQGYILDAARRFGWLVYHPPDNRPITSARGHRYVQNITAGWFDLTLAHVPARKIIFREVKTRKGRVSADQKRWHEAFAAAGYDVGIWRPGDWPTIVDTLARPHEAPATTPENAT